MVAATVGAAWRAARISEAWPSCRYPMVGTRASDPSRRASWQARRKSCAVRTSGSTWSLAPGDGVQLDRGGHRARLLRAERILVGGKGAAPHLFAIAGRSVANDLREVRILLHELRRELRVHAEQVVDHEHLPVALLAGADADGGDADAAGDLRPERARDGLEDERVAARLFQRLGVGQEARRLVLAAALDHVAAHLVARLRGE